MAAVLRKKDIQSETWARIAAYLAEELEEARTQLESKLISPEITAALRGDISRIRKLLALAPSPDPAAAPGSRGNDGNQEEEEVF